MADRLPLQLLSGDFKQFDTGDTVPILNGGTGETTVSGVQSAFDITERNRIINGEFRIWQKGTLLNNAIKIADRWEHSFDGTTSTTVSQQPFILGQTAVPSNPKYYMRVITNSQTSATFNTIGQKIENVETGAGIPVTVSVYAKGKVGGEQFNISLDQFFGSGGSPSSTVSTTVSSNTLTTSWVRYTGTVTLSSVSGKTLGTNGDDSLKLNFKVPLNVGSEIDIANVEVKTSGAITDYKERSITEEEMLAYRYYYRYATQANFYGISSGIVFATTFHISYFFLPVDMRVAPTFGISNASDFQLVTTGTTIVPSAVTASFTGTNMVAINTTISGGTANNVGQLRFNTTSTAYMDFDAEL